MNCSKARDQLVQTSGRAAPAATLEQLEEHLQSCTACRVFAERLELSRAALRAHHAGVEPSAQFAPAVLAALPERRPMLGWAAVRLLPAAFALALVLSGWAVLFSPSPRAITQAITSESTRNGTDALGAESDVEETDVFTWIVDTTGDPGS